MSLFTSTVTPLDGWPPRGSEKRDPPYGCFCARLPRSEAFWFCELAGLRSFFGFSAGLQPYSPRVAPPTEKHATGIDRRHARTAFVGGPPSGRSFSGTEPAPFAAGRRPPWRGGWPPVDRRSVIHPNVSRRSSWEKMAWQPDDHHGTEHGQGDAEPEEFALASFACGVGMRGQGHAAVAAFGFLRRVGLLTVQAPGHGGVLRRSRPACHARWRSRLDGNQPWEMPSPVRHVAGRRIRRPCSITRTAPAAGDREW